MKAFTPLLCLATTLVLLAPPLHAAAEAMPAAPSAAAEPALTLEEAIRLALAKGHLVRISSFNVPIARAGLTEAWGRFDPRLNASYTESLNETPLSPFASGGATRPFLAERGANSSVGLEGQTPFGTSYQLGAKAWKLRNEGSSTLVADNTTAFAGLSLTQPLLRDAGFTSLTQVRVARTNLAISEWEFRETLTDTVNQVIGACAQLQFAESRLAIAQKSLELARQLRSDNERRRNVGAMSDYDVLSADARVADREESALQAARGLEHARNTLRSLISGDRAGLLSHLDLRLAELPLPAARAIDRAADLRQALDKRPDYRRAQLLCRRGADEKGLALNQLLPRVDLVGSYGYNALAKDVAGARKDLRSREHAAWSAGLQVSIPVGSVGERGRYRAAKLRLRQSEALLEKLEQDVAIDIANAADQLEATHRRVEAAGRARQLNQQALEAEVKKLRAGTGSTFAVLYQQDQLGYAENTEAYARADLLRAAADYDRATGRTLDAHNIVPTR